jgi:hypothetical protein
MRPVDIKGRPIYSRIFSVLEKHGAKLVTLKWVESRKKPNLFYKTFSGIVVFADMRGTEIVPIWDEPYPYVYDSAKSEEDWKRRRAVNKAVAELDSVNVPHRFSFYEECEPDGLFFGYDEELADGTCKVCRKEFDHDGLFCSDECEKIRFEEEKRREQEWQREAKSRKTESRKADLRKRKNKALIKEMGFGEGETYSKKTNQKPLQDAQNNLDSPSEAFKKSKAKRDKVKHPRY